MTVEPEYIKQLAEVDARSKSNTHRLDRLEELTDAIHQQGETLAVICNQLQTQGETLKKQGDRLEAVEKKPGDLWDKVIAAAISAIVGGVIGAVIAALAI